MRNLFRFLSILAVTLWLSLTASNALGQDEPKICISRAAAEACATNATKVSALEARILLLETALRDKDKIIEDLKVDGALKTGRIIALEQNDASNRAIIEILIKNARPKRIGLINIF